MAQLVNLPAMQETQVQSLGWEDPLEKEMATHSSNLAWGIPWTEEPGGLQSKGFQKVRHDSVTKHSTAHMSCIPPFIHYFPDVSVVKNLPAMQETRFFPG